MEFCLLQAEQHLEGRMSSGNICSVNGPVASSGLLCGLRGINYDVHFSLSLGLICCNPSGECGKPERKEVSVSQEDPPNNPQYGVFCLSPWARQ